MPVSLNHFMYGNSLVNFTGGSFESNVPHWLNQLAEANSSSYAGNGGFGFLRQFADRETPQNGWGFAGVDGAWDDDFQSFEDVTFDAVTITPANFIQYQAPDANYEGDDRSPLDATVDVINDTLLAQPDAQIYIYEGWADLGSNFGYPVTEAQLSEYHNFNAGAYHDWYVDYVDQINAAVPEANVELIPVASIMADLFENGPLSDLTLDELYVDDAPHGTETVYMLAGMVVYPVLFGEDLPANFDVPDTIHPALADNYTEIAAQITTALSEGGVTVDPVDPIDPVDPVGDVNEAPQAVNDAETLLEGETAIIDVLANDSDADGDPLSLLQVGPAGFGVVDIINGRAVYTPDAGYTGSDSFTYQVSDGQGGVAVGRVDVQIAAAPPTDPDTGPDTGGGVIDPPVTPDPDAAQGFAARYFDVSQTTLGLDQVDFTGEAVATGTIDALQYLETDEAFAAGTGADYFAAQYLSTLDVSEAGSHELFMVADDEARIYLDGELIMDTSGREPGDMTTVRLDLAQGAHELEVQYLEVAGEQSLYLDWIGPSTGNQMEAMTGTVPSAVDPAPVDPDPTPDPVDPDPVPEPVDPDPVPDPVDPDPTPDPVDPDPVPDPVDPDPTPDPVDPDPTPDPVDPDPTPAPVDPDPVPDTPVNTATTDYGVKAFATSSQDLGAINFRQSGDVETTVKGVTLASENGALVEGGPQDGAVQFVSSVSVETSGLYRISLAADDQATVSISGLPIVNADASDAGVAQSGSVFLIAGTHTFDVRYLDTGGAQSLDVTWSGPDTGGADLPLGDAFDPLSALASEAIADQAALDLDVQTLIEDEAGLV